MASVWATIAVAVLGFIGSVIGTVVAGNKTTALVVYRLQELEKKVEKHNNVVERVYRLEGDVETVFSKINELKK